MINHSRLLIIKIQNYENSTQLNSTQLNSTRLTNKTKFGILLFGIIIISIIVQSFSLNMNYLSGQSDYAEHPPSLQEMTIQKMNDSLSSGENVIVRPTYTYYDSMPQTLYLFTGQDSFEFNDDGAYPDEEANDHKYAAFMKIDISGFLLDIENRENELETMEQFIVFEGHEGHFEDSIPPFDINGFNAFMEVQIQSNLILADQCKGSILKQNSLFITDLDVVEDPTRTYYPVGNGTGTPNGIWTFGKFMSNMANTSPSSDAASNFIKNWLKFYLVDIESPNGREITPKRDLIIKYLIRPWIGKANNAADEYELDDEITNSTWEDKWEEAQEDHPGELVKNAPFKLTAIVNRIDLRNNIGYTNKITRAGETRFIFTAINLYTITGTDFSPGNEGEIIENPVNNNQAFDFIDWKGMNVIFEFGNIQNNLCDLKTFAQAWKNLTGLDLGSAAYNEALENITETVINAGAASGRPNSSALNQLRTNEKIFFNTVSNSLEEVQAWAGANWQFRQFEISEETNQLEQVPLSNTPIISDFNTSRNTSGTARQSDFSFALTDWLYKNKNKVKAENFTIPETYYNPSTSETYTFLDRAGDIDAEYSTYWDVDYDQPPSNYSIFNSSTELISSNTQTKQNGKDIRFAFSLNTCQGCHSGENKTFFTQVAPLNKGESARYWLTTPDTKTGLLDTRTNSFTVPKNNGKTVRGTQSSPTTVVDNYGIPSGTREFVSVSAFITGRTYDGNSYDDDEPDNSFDPDDDNMEGLYYVNDPGNVRDQYNQTANVFNYFGKDDQRHGFNELNRRRKDLCVLVNINCHNPSESIDVIDLMKNLNLMPLVE